MKNTILITCAILAIIFACGEEQSSTSSSDKLSPKPKAKTVSVDGKAVYTKNCVVCHGVKGDMGASGAFNLTTSELSEEERVAVITNGRNTMAAYKDLLKEEEIAAVAAYTMTLTKTE